MLTFTAVFNTGATTASVITILTSCVVIVSKYSAHLNPMH